MAIMPINIPLPSESAVVTYDYTDFAEGTGVVQLYAGTLKTSAATTYVLSRNNFESYHLSNYIIAQTNGAAPGTPIDIDCDLTAFNTPRTIKGTAVCNVAVYNGGNAVVNNITIKFRKWDGATETEIASVTSPTLTNSVEQYVSMPVVLPQTNFKIGETLRITMQMTTVSGGNTYSGFGLSPTGDAITVSSPGTLTFSAGNSVTKFYVPFKIDR